VYNYRSISNSTAVLSNADNASDIRDDYPAAQQIESLDNSYIDNDTEGGFCIFLPDATAPGSLADVLYPRFSADRLFSPSLAIFDWTDSLGLQDEANSQSRDDGIPTQPEADMYNQPYAAPTKIDDLQERARQSGSELSVDIDSHDSTSLSFLEWHPRRNENVVTFPDMSLTSSSILEAEDFGHVDPLEEHKYDEIDKLLRDSNGGTFRPYQFAVMPPIHVVNCFIQLYFEKFHPEFPLLHRPTFQTSTQPVLLILAVAATGCRFSKAPNSRSCHLALQELLRRAIKIIVRNLSSKMLRYACMIPYVQSNRKTTENADCK
jgi:hypothetical protein